MRLPVIGHISDAKLPIKPTVHQWDIDYYEPLACACGSTGDQWVMGRLGDGMPMDLWRCSGCGTRRVSPYPSEAALNLFYQNYRSGEDTFHSERQRAERQAGWLLRYVYPRSILDKGCGCGGSLWTWRNAWPTATCIIGTDADEAAVEHATRRGLQAYCQTDWLDNRPADLVVLSHIAEHTPTVVRLLSEAHRVGEYVFIEVPHIGEPSIWNWKWIYQTEFPHCWYFTMPGLKTVCRLAGWHVVAEETSTVLRILATR